MSTEVYIPTIPEEAVSPNIEAYIFSKAQSKEYIANLLLTKFRIGHGILDKIYEKHISPHLETLKDDIYFLAETKYVDKVYRDTYYKYHSSKFSNLSRYCIRLSIFDGKIEKSLFTSKQGYESLKKKYLGFYVLRPTYPYLIGRSVISPKALNYNDFICCLSTFGAIANGLKFQVTGFPHSSQDSETMTCAETSLWAIMEYFGNKYPEYNGVLPSKIINSLNEISIERQIPSKGLDIHQMSYALKQFGFGSRIYSKEHYTEEFDQLLSCYVESGIPLIASMGNDINGDDGIEHAFLIIGHKNIDPVEIDDVVPLILREEEYNTTFIIYDYDKIKKDFILVDDNSPAYQSASLLEPAKHYKNDNWNECKIHYFLVPLYPKIYLEANEAKKYVTCFIESTPAYSDENDLRDTTVELVTRIFLASSRSFKAEIALDENLSLTAKALIVEAPMPKFIWVAEISNRQLIKQKKADGLIVLDATEANHEFNKPLIFAFFQGKMFRNDKVFGKLRSISVDLGLFDIYQRNLKTEEINN